MSSNIPYEPWVNNLLQHIKMTLNVCSQSLSSPKVISKTVKEIIKKHNNVIPRKPEPYSLEPVRKAVWLAIKNNTPLTKLSKRYLRRIPWILFERERTFEEIEERIIEFLRWLYQYGSASTIRTMLIVFLNRYPEKLSTFELWRRDLKTILVTKHLPSLLGWKKRCEEFSLLEPRGYERFTSIFLENNVPPDHFLAEAGFTGELARAKFLSRACVALLEQLKQDIEIGKISPSVLSHGIEFFISNKSELRFPEYRIDIINKLLSPFIGDIDPTKEHLLNIIAKFLIKTFGDPRLPSATRWHGVSTPAKQVIMRWLTGITLEDFFRILDYTVKSGNYSHHWPYRRAFWLAYFKKGHIVEAWVLLGPIAQEYVKKIDDWELKTHGRLLKGDLVLPNHSVLLLKFKGGLVVAEWSHNGKGRFWLPGNKNAPQFYKSKYYRREVVDNCDFEFIHVYGEKYSWQRKVSKWIKEQIGVFVSPSEYRID